MKCPNCNEILLMTERHQVEIDYCPNCRGVWLDKGELDKLMEYASNQTQARDPRDYDRQNSYQQDQREEYRDDRYDRDHRDHRDYRGQNQKYPRKKKSFLSDFFDFD